MSNKQIGLIAVGCLAMGVVAGVAGAQAALQHEGLHTGLFSLEPTETANFRLSFDAPPGTPAARAFLKLINASGAVVANQNALLQPGQSATLVSPPGSELLRARADVFGSVSQPAPTRAVGTVEVADTITGQRRFVCSFDPVGVGGGRN